MQQKAAPFDWDILLTELQNKQIVPIVGSELLEITVADRTCSLDRFIAEALVEKFDFDLSSLPKDYTLNDVAWHYLLSKEGKRSRLHDAIRNIFLDRCFATPKPLRQLAEISDLTLFVSMTFDPLLETALNETRFHGRKETRKHCYSLHNNRKLGSNELDDLGTDPVSQSETTVFYLMGSEGSRSDFVVTDEDALEFLHSLREEGKGRPENLFDRLRESYLLLLGCNYPDWLTRFFLRMLSGNRMTEDSSRIEYVVDRSTPTDSILERFLRNINVTVYEGNSAVEFVDQLHQRWSERQAKAASRAADALGAAGPAQAASCPGTVFLSYASEDRPAVLSLKRALENEGIRVWYDQRSLEVGENYDRAIKSKIRDCTIFFLCISQQALRAIHGLTRRYFLEEWTCAMGMLGMSRNDRFIWPIVLDGTEAGDQLIPPALRELHMQRCPEGAVSADFLARLKRSLAEEESKRSCSA